MASPQIITQIHYVRPILHFIGVVQVYRGGTPLLEDEPRYLYMYCGCVTYQGMPRLNEGICNDLQSLKDAILVLRVSYRLNFFFRRCCRVGRIRGEQWVVFLCLIGSQAGSGGEHWIGVRFIFSHRPKGSRTI